MILLQFPLCTPILTFDPQLEKTAIWGGKTPKKRTKFFLRLCDTHKKYILQKKWTKTVNPALSSDPNILQPAIWGHHHQLMIITETQISMTEII